MSAPSLGKGHSDCAADAAVSSGDERYLVFKLSRTGSSAILYARPGLHLGLKPRLAILLLPGTRRLFFLLGHFCCCSQCNAICGSPQNACRHRCHAMFRR